MTESCGIPRSRGRRTSDDVILDFLIIAAAFQRRVVMSVVLMYAHTRKGAAMRILPTTFLGIAMLGAAIVPVWSQAQPASRTAPLGSSTGATAAALCSGRCAWQMLRNESALIPRKDFTRTMDRLGGGSVNPAPTGKAVLGSNNARVPVAATAKPVIVQPQPKTPDTNFSYGAGSSGGKKDVFKPPR